ncbi:MAG: ATP-binding protein [Ignavibacteria bacterium]|jgi:two-component system phosphate regulon sensor histidine kinase PhoR
MNKTLKRIGFFIIIIVLLPIIILVSFQLNSLSENEKMLQEIYGNQLDAILFSVNQFSEDLTDSWANDIEQSFHTRDEYSFGKSVIEMFNMNSFMRMIFVYNLKTQNNVAYVQVKDGYETKKNLPLMNEIILKHDKKIKRLLDYKKSGYRKIEPAFNTLPDTSSMLFFVIDSLHLGGIVFLPDVFAREQLEPKMRAVSKGKFIINIFKDETMQIISQTEPTDIVDLQQTRELWLLPGYSMGITLKGVTIYDLVKKRGYNFLFIVSLLVILLLIGLWFIVKNINKEIKLAQIKSEFVSNVSHELRTPLALITMFAETLEMGRVNSEEKKQEYYKIISRETGRLSRIVNTILNFSKMEAGKREFTFEENDLNDIVKKVIKTYSFHIRNKGFKVKFNEVNGNLRVKADEEAVYEAIINLVDNAIKYSRDIKEIEITTGSVKENVFVEVKDHGIGVSDEDQKKIFEKFYRVPTGLVHNVKGTGLGLTLVKQIMDHHEGKIELKSELQKGSSFKLIFPHYNNSNEI